MSEKDTPEMDECLHVSYHIPKWLENGKIHWDDVQLQHKSLNAEAKCIVPPTKAIPVIFIPGIMGTNLKNSEGKKVWRADLLMGMDTLSLLKLDGDERRNLLNVASTFVDNRGSIYPAKRSFISDDGNLFPSRKERHWGEALYLSYGEFLDYFQHALIDDWQNDLRNVKVSERLNEKRTLFPEAVEKQKRKGELSHLIGEPLGDTHDSPLTEEELSHFKHFLFPVHVFGYNWLQDNAISAANLVSYIDNIMETYKYDHGHGLAIEKVIIVTHSMGGLIARYASQVLGAKDKILGIVHGVIPDIGSPAAYRRMKTGAHKEGIAGKVLGQNAEELMSVLAFAPAPLQLLPTAKYPSNWLEIEGEGSYPKIDPFDEIYLRNDVWWRLYEPDILDKDPLIVSRNWDTYDSLVDKTVRAFVNKLDEGKYHPNTYVFYGQEIESDGKLAWKKEPEDTIPLRKGGALMKAPYSPKGKFKYSHVSKLDLPYDRYPVLSGNDECDIYVLTQSNTAGDGTVPVESLGEVKKTPGIKSILATGVDHQNAYALLDPKTKKGSHALKFTLRSIVKMVQEVDIRAAD